MASAWITTVTTTGGEKRYRVGYRVGGRDTATMYAGTFKAKRDALTRRAWVSGELAAMRIPDLKLLAEPEPAATFADVAERWKSSRVDVRASTAVQHRVALARVTPIIGDLPVDRLIAADVAGMVAKLTKDGYGRETVRRSLVVTQMVCDFAGLTPNPARDKLHVKLPRAEAEDITPPTADHVEAVAHLLTVPYMVALLTLDATGCRIGELASATLGDLDEGRRAWLLRKANSKTKRERWIELPTDLYAVLLERLPAREDRDLTAPLFGDLGNAGAALRTAISRACRDGGVPAFSPHGLRHRRISLWHQQGVDWATIGLRVGQSSIATTAEIYTHVLLDPREVKRSELLARARLVQTSVRTRGLDLPASAGRL